MRLSRRAREAAAFSAACFGLLAAGHGASAAGACTQALFVCESDRAGKVISICGSESADGSRWEDIQYSFGPEGAPELVYPEDPARGASLLFFSHEKRGDDYRVSIRFETGPWVYRVYSSSAEEGAGVKVNDRSGKLVSTVHCAERPALFSTYLRQSLACDLANPHGRKACLEKPYEEAR